MRKLLALSGVLALLEACGGSSGTPALPGGSQQDKTTASATATITIPWKTPSALHRSPKWIPSSTMAIDFLARVGGQQVAYTAASVMPTSPNCVSGSSGLTCTVPFAVVPGPQQLTVTVYDAYPVSNGSPLATVTQTVTATGGTGNSFSFVLNGIPAIVYTTASIPIVQAGTPASFSLPMQAEDVDGDQITGPYDSPINTVTDDATHAITVAPGQLTSGSNTLNVNIAPNLNTATTMFSYCTPLFGIFCGSNNHGPFFVTVQVPSGTVYVANNGNGTIEAFAPGANGNAAPIRTIATNQLFNPAKTFIRGNGGNPSGLMIDGFGTVRFTEPSTNAWINVASGAGNSSPTSLTFLTNAGQGPNTTLNHPSAIQTDNTGHVWVTNSGANALLQVNGGNQPPLKSISGPLTTLNNPTGLATDSAGNLYVINNGSAVLRFASSSSGNVAPLAAITSSAFTAASGIAVSGSNLYVADAASNTIAIFPASSAGATGPSATITSPALSSPAGIAFDSSGNMYVANTASNTIAVFAAGATGSITPIRTIAGTATNLSQPIGIGVR